MYLNKYNPIDIGTLWTWAKARGSYMPQPSEMPEIRYVASERGEPIAMGFLRRVEGGYAQLDGLITNPEAPGDMRSYAIDTVVAQLLETARQLEIKAVMATSIDKNTLERSKKFGFIKQDMTVIIVDTTKA